MEKRFMIHWGWGLAMVLVTSPVWLKASTSQLDYWHVQTNIWHVEIVDTDHLYLADFDGRISLWNTQSQSTIWSYPTEAFVFDLKAADIDRDGKVEALVVTAEGDLLVLSREGKKLWSYQSEHALFNVVAANLAGDEQLEVACGGIDRHVRVFGSNGNQLATAPAAERLVHRLVAGNLDEDPYDELLSIENRTVAHLLKLEGNSLNTLWRKPLQVSSEMVNWENPRGSFFPFFISIHDLDGDGSNEILMGDTFFNKQSVMVTDNQTNPLWISEGIPPFAMQDGAQLEFYSTAFVRAADIYPDVPGMEVVSVTGGLFRVWSKDGRLLGSQNTQLGFTDFEVTGSDLYLGSCPNGDEFIYRFHMGADWKEAAARFEFQGLVKTIKENTRDLANQIDQYRGPLPTQKQTDLIIGFGSIQTTDEGLALHHQQEAWFKNRFPFANLRLVKNLKVMEPTPPLDENGQPWYPYRWTVDSIRGTDAVEEIIAKAEWIEVNRIPTLFYIGHSCMPFITLETAEKILQAAPEFCVGFITAEDEQIELIPRYFEHYFQGLADLCLQYGNKVCITKNKGLWWMTSPSIPQVYEALFREGRNRVAMASTEDSNSRTPELNLMARGGLWQAGLLQHNEVSIHGDLFSFNRFQQWEYPRAGHPYLRLLVAHTTMGMTMINSRIREYTPTSDTAVIETIGKECTEIFYKLLGKGIVFSPRPEDILGYSPIGLVVHHPPEKWLADAHNGHRPEEWVEDEALHQAVFPHNGNLWGNTNTPEHALTRVLFEKKRQYGYQVPPTPYGLVAIVPEFTDLTTVAHVKDWWHTDGVYAWREGGPKYTGQKAAQLIQADFKTAAAKLPFKQTGELVFLNAARVAEDHYRLFLVDPGWIDPEDHIATIEIQLPGKFKAWSTLDGSPLPIINKRLEVLVPAGLFHIVDVQKMP